MAHHDLDLSALFQALSDPTRRAMLARLGAGAMPVTALAGPTGLALPTVLRHLTVLEQARLIITRKEGRTRLCQTVPETLVAAESWLAARRAEWEARTDRLAAFAEMLEDEDAPEPRNRS